MIRFSPVLLICLATIGCTPNLKGLVDHLGKGSHDLAVAQVTGDPEMEEHLAALILQMEAVQSPDSAYDITGTLAASGRPGVEALKRLSSQKLGPVSTMAQIRLDRLSLPREARLNKLLKDDSSDVRACAASTWARRMDKAPLLRLFMDTDPRVRLAAVSSLGNSGDKKGTSKVLLETLRLDPDPRVRSAAARRGKALGAGALDALRDALADDNMGVRHGAMFGLSALGTREALALLEDLVMGPMDESVVVAAAQLARAGSKRGRSRFMEALGDRSPNVRKTALVNLSTVENADARKHLVDALDDEAPNVVLAAAGILLRDGGDNPKVNKALEKIVEEGGSYADEARDLLAVAGQTDAIADIEAGFLKWIETDVVATLSRVRRVKNLRGAFVQLMADGRKEVRIAAARAVLSSG